MEREQLEDRFELNEPAENPTIDLAEQNLGIALPEDYRSFLRISNGLTTAGNLVLLEAEDIAERNRDYEVQEYLPGHVMIGDDSGGNAILMKLKEPTIFEVDMGAMDEESKELCASSLEELLVDLEGKTLNERA